MRRRTAIRLAAGLLLLGMPGIAAGASLAPGTAIAASATAGEATVPPNVAAAEQESLPDTGIIEQPPEVRIADPIETVNRGIFVFNDKAYYWVLKPVARGYNYVVPQGVRVAVRNFFRNLATPIRFVNHLLQGDLRGSGTALARFTINSTIGFAGFFDVAHDSYHIDRKEADLGQTLGRYGLGQGMYLVVPLLGPMSLRDGVGQVGDLFLDPISYLNPTEAALAVNAYKRENNVSLELGAYEDLTESALDPYVAVRDAYAQHRAEMIRRK
jgi:phospholipid-binding lipoprotein MlaA